MFRNIVLFMSLRYNINRITIIFRVYEQITQRIDSRKSTLKVKLLVKRRARHSVARKLNI